MRFSVAVYGPQLEQAVGHLAVVGIQTITRDFRAVEAVVTAEAPDQAAQRLLGVLPPEYGVGQVKPAPQPVHA